MNTFQYLKTFIVFVLASYSVCYAQIMPLTIAESSNYQSTSRYSDVFSFINQLQQQSPLLRVETIATTTEGRDIPMIILGDPPPSSPLELKYDDRMVVYFQGNIHAGEVEGKEGLQILARELVQNKDLNYLDRLVILIVPIFNADGNEKISTHNRTRQVGPANGVGERQNGQNLDLNRDGLKLESPEVHGLVQKVLIRWDPYLILDSHTHNGSYHQEPVTFVWSLNPNGDTTLVRYASDVVYENVRQILRDNYDLLCIPHGDFVDVNNPEKGWMPLGPQPRYLSNYFGLRNRIGILNENYPYADFKTRVTGSYKLFRALLDFSYHHRDDIRRLVQAADRRTVQRGLIPTENDIFALNYNVRPTKNELTVQGYEMKIENNQEQRRPRVIKSDVKKTYKMPFLAEFYPGDTVRLPFAYLFDSRLIEIAQKLHAHGIVVEILTEPVELNVETFIISEVTNNNSLNQGHYLSKVSGSYKMATKQFSEGTYIVPMAQPLANLVSYLLEPESDDGLVRWNFFDRYIVKQWSRTPLPYPIFKLYSPANIAKVSIN